MTTEIYQGTRILRDGKGGMYATCLRCQNLIKLNKWLFGSMHTCLTAEEEEANERRAGKRNHI